MAVVLRSKEEVARCMLRSEIVAWFRDQPIDQRDQDLINADHVGFVDYNKGSYLRKIYHMKPGEAFKQTQWVVETDQECKELVQSAGGKTYGFDNGSASTANWASVTVNVNINATPGAGFDWGFLSTQPHHIRIFKGPAKTCSEHPWDAMILRDCTSNTHSLCDVGSVASRKWDILCMKMCEDYDHPWVVIAVKDAGPVSIPSGDVCGCQDPTACGCIIAK
ncbi:hypothetical protein LTR72_005114 [Exophiala xenobiotica]|nr:hypothetical protein LTR92_001283 [Exophiala xenobiotica]KAK5223728.1 hypothetical protein LTR72_005114 [Exophiala xenobiotica]KAK5289129.1 hypothetical protein LTR14_007380 [Exophiala xenobiotica]KAK5500023.1 hypothetical protein LTR55_000846 [Exophiala xenobiotica]